MADVQALLKTDALQFRQINQTMRWFRSIASNVIYITSLIAITPTAAIALVWSAFSESFANEVCVS